MAAYAVALLVAEWAIHRFHPTGALLYALAVCRRLPIIGIIVVVGLYLAEEKDEFQRNLLIQSMLWGLGAIIALTSVWGWLQLYAHVHPFQPFMTFPLFWCFQAIAAATLQRRYR